MCAILAEASLKQSTDLAQRQSPFLLRLYDSHIPFQTATFRPKIPSGTQFYTLRSHQPSSHISKQSYHPTRRFNGIIQLQCLSSAQKTCFLFLLDRIPIPSRYFATVRREILTPSPSRRLAILASERGAERSS